MNFMFPYIYIYRECHHPNWRTRIFQYGWNHQPVWLQGDWWLDSIWQWILKHDTYVTLCYIYNIWANDGTPNVHHWVDGIRLEDSRSITCCPDVSMDFLDTLRCIHTIYREFMGMCIYIINIHILISHTYRHTICIYIYKYIFCLNILFPFVSRRYILFDGREAGKKRSNPRDVHRWHVLRSMNTISIYSLLPWPYPEYWCFSILRLRKPSPS